MFSGRKKRVPHSCLPTLKHLLDNRCEMEGTEEALGRDRHSRGKMEAYLSLASLYILPLVFADGVRSM